jgi:hypothetical protein
LGFSHAYYRAIRHAITVGFVSLMIVGVAAKVVLTLNGIDVRSLSPLWGPFLLLNAGCALRVVGQTLTDFAPTAFPVAGVSSLLGLSELVLWGLHLGAVMAGRVRLRWPAEAPTEPTGGEPITGGSCVGAVLELSPGLLDTFLAFGFRPLASAFLRRTLAGRVTVACACRLLAVDAGQLLDALNRERLRLAGGRLSLPVLSG